MKKIVLTGGGTGGHVIPNIAILPLLHSNFDEIHYIGSKNGIEKEIISKYPKIKYHSITTVKLKRSLSLSNLTIPFKLIAGIIQSKKLLKTINPNVIFSKGGFVAVPVVLAHGKIPVVGHESDMTLGLANKLILKRCKAMCCSFEKTTKNIGKKAVYTGSPIRQDFIQSSSNLIKFSNTKPTLLVIEGSLGSTALNNAVWNNFNTLLKKYNVIHLVGKGKFNKSLSNKDYIQLEQTNDMSKIYHSTDYVMSRAGSNTVFEIMALHLPSVLVPLPKTESRGDQIDNAKELSQKGLCKLLFQENIDSKSLINTLSQLEKDKNKIVSNLIKQDFSQGNKKIVEVILNYSL